MAGWAFLGPLIQYGVVSWVVLGTKSAGHEVATPYHALFTPCRPHHHAGRRDGSWPSTATARVAVVLSRLYLSGAENNALL